MNLKPFHHIINQFGFFPKNTLNSFKGIIPFLRNYYSFKKKNDLEFKIKSFLPNLFDRYESAGEISLHYFHQDLFVAQKIFQRNPIKHVDIGSRIDGFVSNVASFREIEVFDIRPLAWEIKNIKFIKADLMSNDFSYYDYTDSISSLHAIEHFGLGRYGDKIDPEGHLKGLRNIFKLLKQGGKFYFASPIGHQRIEFDAHRVFSIKYLLSLFNKDYKIDSFSLIDDNNNFHPEVVLDQKNIENNFGCNYGCGIFELVKL